MIAYLKRFLVAIRTKLTVYVTSLTATIAMLPELISDYWAQLEQNLPHLKVYHGVVVGTGVLLTIWSRVRREITTPKPPAPPQP